jgi:hypothetical protein
VLVAWALAVSAIVLACNSDLTTSATDQQPRNPPARDVGPDAWPHEPAWLPKLSDYGFDDALPQGSDVPVGGSGWSIINSAGLASQLTNVTSAPFSQPNVGQWSYPVNFAGGPPATMYRNAPYAKEVYFGTWWKVSTPWQDPASGTSEIAQLLTGGTNSLAALVMQATGATPAHTIEVITAFDGIPAGRLSANVTASEVAPGTWHRLEWYLKYSSTPSSSDGIIRWWVDGVLQGDRTDINMPADSGFYEYRISPRWDGTAKTEQDYAWFDHVRVAAGSDPLVEPQFSATAYDSIWADDFQYQTDPEIWAGGKYAGNNVTMSQIHVAPNAGPDGSTAVRMDWQAQSSGNCIDDNRLLEKSFSESAELYLQYWVKYQSGFVFDWAGHPLFPGNEQGNAKKLALVLTQESSGRFDFIAENHSLGLGADIHEPLYQQNAGGTPFSLGQLGDGQWHRITIHFRRNSAPTVDDGFEYAWIDSTLRWSYSGIPLPTNTLYNTLQLSATFNCGSPVTQSEWLDGLRIWRPR